MSRETDIAWCAGFFDGEGHVSCKRGYPNTSTGRVSPQLYANIPQAADNIEPLQFFQSVIGFGKIKGPYKTKNKDKYVVHYGVREVESLFKILAPYLRAEKTTDFQHALLGYLMFDHTPTAEDWTRAHKRELKKMRK